MNHVARMSTSRKCSAEWKTKGDGTRVGMAVARACSGKASLRFAAGSPLVMEREQRRIILIRIGETVAASK